MEIEREGEEGNIEGQSWREKNRKRDGEKGEREKKSCVTESEFVSFSSFGFHSAFINRN